MTSNRLWSFIGGSHGQPTARSALSLAIVLTMLVLTITAPTLGATVSTKPTCDAAHRKSCFYRSNLRFPAGLVDGIELVDPDRNDYRVPILVRYPIGAEGPRPVIIWHHGGTPAAGGRHRSAEWGTMLAKAGYVVIHPARVPLSDVTGVQAECDTNGIPDPTDCASWVAQWLYGSMNTAFIIEHFDEIESADAALDGMLDDDLIAVGGHSAGTGMVHSNAGAWQQWTTIRYEDPISQPVAFLAAAPHGPMYAGFNSGFQSKDGDAGWNEHSWVDVDRPFMFITGAGDETNEPPEARVAGFLTSVAGNKFLLWDTSPEALHETMDIQRCETPLRAAHCKWIGSAGLAFFDASVRGRLKAKKWLRSNEFKFLTAGAIEIHRR